MIYVNDEEVRAVRRQIEALLGQYPLESAKERFGGASVLLEEPGSFSETPAHQTPEPVETTEVVAPASAEIQSEVVVAPIMPDGSLTFVLRCRFGRDHWSLELPRGSSQIDDQSWRMTAERELLASTGLVANDFQLLGGLSCDLPGVATSIYVVAAHACQAQQAPAWNDRLLIAGSVRVTAGSIDALIRRGDIECILTLSALPLARLHLADAGSA